MKLIVKKTNEVYGTIKASGSKNTALPMIACSLLTCGTLVLNNVPNITDVNDMLSIIKTIGIDVCFIKEKNKLILKKRKIFVKNLPNNVYKIRASYYIMAGLIANKKSFTSIYPGGCSFSTRPIDFHLNAFKKVGYQIKEKNNIITFKKRITKIGKLIYKLPKKSVGATINIIIISVLRKAKSIIYNPSQEPEVLELIKLLNKMGAKIEIVNENIIVINKTNRLHGTTFDVVSDRIEIGSYMLLACSMNKANIKIENACIKYMKKVIEVIKNLGVSIYINKGVIHLIKDIKPLNYQDITITDYPSFPTDLQQILTVCLLNANNESTIKDMVYPNRITHIKQLVQANAKVKYINEVIYINPSELSSTNLVATDLRCGFACILMGLKMKENTVIIKAENILRGYENIVEKLAKIGVNVNIEEE